MKASISHLAGWQQQPVLPKPKGSGQRNRWRDHLRYACHDHGQVVQEPGAFGS